MSAPTLDLVFLGCGQAASMHSRTLRGVSGVRRHYASRDGRRARDFAGKVGGAGHYDGYEAALEDPAMDVAVITTPPATHAALVAMALEREKDVIVEKPAFLGTAELDAAADHARRVGRRIFVAENYAYKPLARALRRVVEGGRLGDILFLQVNALKRQRTGDWRDDPALAGGGALFEGGIHWLSLLGNIGLTIARATLVPAGPDERARGRSALVALEYEEGAAASLAYSWDVPSPLQGLRLSRIYGTRGSAAFESNGLFLATSRRPWPTVPGLRDIAGYRAMFQDFLGALRTGREPTFTLERARRDLELLDAMAGPTARAHDHGTGTQTGATG